MCVVLSCVLCLCVILNKKHVVISCVLCLCVCYVLCDMLRALCVRFVGMLVLCFVCLLCVALRSLYGSFLLFAKHGSGSSGSTYYWLFSLFLIGKWVAVGRPILRTITDEKEPYMWFMSV